jgi:hypothetical protein
MASSGHHHPSSLRNRAPILAELQRLLSRHVAAAEGEGEGEAVVGRGRWALEVASGSGAHVEVFAPAFPALSWQPSDCVGEAELAALDRVSATTTASRWPGRRWAGRGALSAGWWWCIITSQVGTLAHPNILPALRLDASTAWEEGWPPEVRARAGEFVLVYNSNMAHISPWACTLGLLAGAAQALRAGGLLVMYGPFKVGGKCTTESNAAFDASLRQRNPQ